MKRVLVTLLLLPCFLLCRAQNDLTKRGKDILQEYLSGIQSGVDVTPLVIGIKDKYGKANEEQQKEFRNMLAIEISKQLSNNQRESARSVINIYQMVADQDDERLPKLYYIFGNIYSEQKDTTNLKNTISLLKKHPGDSGSLDVYANALNNHLEHIRNYRPVTFGIEGKWVTDVTENSKWGWCNIPKYQVEITKCGDENRNKITGAHIDHFENKHSGPYSGTFIFRDENAFPQIEKAFGEDSLYLFWSSEKLSNADLEEIALRHQIIGMAGTAVSVNLSKGSKDFEDRIAGQVVGSLVEIVGNAIFDKLLEPKKRIVIIEAWLKKVNNNIFEGVISWRESKVGSNTSNIVFDVTSERVTLMRWERESNVCFLRGWGEKQGKNSISDKFYFHLPYIYCDALKKSPNSELRQVYQDFKNTKLNDKAEFLREYNQKQIEKLKKWCMDNQ